MTFATQLVQCYTLKRMSEHVAAEMGERRKIHRAEEAPDFALESLFHDDNLEAFGDSELRAEARRIIRNNPFIQRLHRGDRDAILAHWIGFEPFVVAFGPIIDRRKMPRQILYDKFGHGPAREKLIQKARAERQLVRAENAQFPLEEMTIDERVDSLEDGTRQMGKEEIQHKGHWLADGKRLRRDYRTLERPYVQGVDELIKVVKNSPDMPFFFGLLGATEYMAEETGEFLNSSPAFRVQFEGDFSRWMRLHAPSTHKGRDFRTTHLGGDLDLARAYTPLNPDRTENVEYPKAAVLAGMKIFELATNDVEATLAPLPRKAA